jgi:nucleoid-associated protein YgaU
MPNDAKLGLVVGMGLVIVVAVVVFRKEVPPVVPSAVRGVSQEEAVESPERVARRVQMVPVPGPIIGMSGMLAPRSRGNREHTIEATDTLVGLARHYYGDGEKARALYEANRARLNLRSPDRLPTGGVLIIPDPNDPIVTTAGR